MDLKLNLGCGRYPLDGFINLDIRGDLHDHFFQRKEYHDIRQWNFREGLGDFGDSSVDAITESHALMYLKVEEYGKFFKEVMRVLKRGPFRITEDNCEYPGCAEFGLPWGNPDSITGPVMMEHELVSSGFEVIHVTPEKTFWKDNTLIQQFHGTPPRVFHMEAFKRW